MKFQVSSSHNDHKEKKQQSKKGLFSKGLKTTKEVHRQQRSMKPAQQRPNKQASSAPPQQHSESSHDNFRNLRSEHLSLMHQRIAETVARTEQLEYPDEKLVRVSSPQRMLLYDDLGNVKSKSFERSERRGR